MSLCPFCRSDVPGDASSEPALAVCRNCMNPLYLEPGIGSGDARAIVGINDVRGMAVEGSLGRDLLVGLAKAMDAIPPLPEVAQQVLKASRDPEVGMNELANLIGEDAVIAAKVLRLSNSALYSGLSEIRDLRSACARLGVKQVANAVQAVAFSGLFMSGKAQYRATMKNFWQHAVASAYAAQEIAKITAAPQAETLFVMGLVHDIGKLAALTVVGKASNGPVAALKDSPGLFADVLEAWHPLLGLHAIRQWGLPNEFGIAALCHDNPATVPHEGWLGMTHIVCLSSAVAGQCGYLDGEPEEVSLVSHPSARFLGLNDLKLAGLRIDLEDKLEEVLASLSATE